MNICTNNCGVPSGECCTVTVVVFVLLVPVWLDFKSSIYVYSAYPPEPSESATYFNMQMMTVLDAVFFFSFMWAM